MKKTLVGIVAVLAISGLAYGQGMISIADGSVDVAGGVVNLEISAIAGGAQTGLDLFLAIADEGAAGAEITGLVVDVPPYLVMGPAGDALIEGAWNTTYVPGWAAYAVDAVASGDFDLTNAVLGLVTIQVPALPLGTQIVVTAGGTPSYPPTDFGGPVPESFKDGIITVTPEPVSMLLLLAGLPLLRRRIA